MDARVVELFAGVGGFRYGLQDSGWDVRWSNQWEPGKKRQWASDCYVKHFGNDGHFNVDIATVDKSSIPRHDLLVGGFPCQDYSVATTQAAGIQGKKGVLWWQIKDILEAKRPTLVLLENVDRLLKSPSAQRGRDFGIMLRCMDDLGYSVEWRTINAANYGAAQKRRRVFILGARKNTRVGSMMRGASSVRSWLLRDGFYAGEFKVAPDAVMPLTDEAPQITIPSGLQRVSDTFTFQFQNAGLMREGDVWTAEVKAKPEPQQTLGDILQREVASKYLVPPEKLPRWKYLKGAKAEYRKARNGFEYYYSEGPIPYPDPINGPARTLLTSEGGTGPSRFKHLVEDPVTRKLRILTPIEAERLNQFPDDWTNTGMPESWRYFCMGNALVVTLVRRMGHRLALMERAEPTPAIPLARTIRSGLGVGKARVQRS